MLNRSSSEVSVIKTGLYGMFEYHKVMISAPLLVIYPGKIITTITFEELLLKKPYTVLYFYPKDNTPGCIIEAHDFSERVDAFEKLGCQIIGVSKNTKGSHHKFIDTCEIKFGLVSDADLQLHNVYQTLKEKSMFGKKYMGTTRSTFVLDSQGTIIREYREVSEVGHAQNVLNDLSTLLLS